MYKNYTVKGFKMVGIKNSKLKKTLFLPIAVFLSVGCLSPERSYSQPQLFFGTDATEENYVFDLSCRATQEEIYNNVIEFIEDVKKICEDENKVNRQRGEHACSYNMCYEFTQDESTPPRIEIEISNDSNYSHYSPGLGAQRGNISNESSRSNINVKLKMSFDLGKKKTHKCVNPMLWALDLAKETRFVNGSSPVCN